MCPQIRRDRPFRRSKRLGLSIRVHVFGQDIFPESFNEFTHMLSLSTLKTDIAVILMDVSMGLDGPEEGSDGRDS